MSQPLLKPPAPESPPPTLYRSGAVARMLRMPVATLRVWERRYGLTQAQLSASGQRLYSADEVRRLALLRQLTELGHAIGSLASLDMPQLQEVAATHAQALAASQGAAAPSRPPSPATAWPNDLPPSPLPAWRLVVVGLALGPRLRNPALLRQLGRPLQLLGPFETLAHAHSALQGQVVDLVLLHEGALHAGWLAQQVAAAPTLAAWPKAVLFRFAADSVCDTLAAAGVALLREPQPEAALAQWLAGLARLTARTAPTQPPESEALTPAPATLPSQAEVPPRRWSDAALADFAGLSSTVACECPRHVAELLTQLSHFEAYSADCQHRSPEDAQLHAYLRQVTAESRARFEQALERLALHEGLLLPRPDSVQNVPG